MSAVEDALGQVGEMVPALLFLCVAVPLAALLDEVGYFDAVAAAMRARAGEISVGALWVLACATTAVLNLDTTIVLLTPLYVRLARRGGADAFRIALIPLLCASLGSSFLPVSNLTTLIVTERLHVSVGDVVRHLAIPGLVACMTGWAMFRRSAPRRLAAGSIDPIDRRALAIGTLVVAGLLVGFVAGGTVGVDPWMVALVADVVLIVITRTVPWRTVPLLTAVGVALIGLAAALLAPESLSDRIGAADSPAAVAGVVVLAAGAANLINNLPAILIGIEHLDTMTWGSWAWLLGVNTGAVILPIGALANLLWWRIVRSQGIELNARIYVRAAAPIGFVALLAAAAALTALRAVSG